MHVEARPGEGAATKEGATLGGGLQTGLQTKTNKAVQNGATPPRLLYWGHEKNLQGRGESVKKRGTREKHTQTGKKATASMKKQTHQTIKNLTSQTKGKFSKVTRGKQAL